LSPLTVGHQLAALNIIDAGTFANADGSRQPSQLELDVAKHQATCVRSPRMSRLQHSTIF
jgi:hypothetical protein